MIICCRTKTAAGKIGWCRSTLGQALKSAQHIAADPRDIPMIVRLCENPSYEIPGFGFDGAVDLHDHDCIHALLGRGLLSLDEAFVIGFTMGSTNRVSTAQEKLYEWASRYLYPKPYNFSKKDIHVFKDAVRLGFVSDCRPLNQVDFLPWMECTLGEVREQLGIETDLLKAYYRIEARRYPKSKASRRLLPLEAT
jgi:hypothetical protein